MNIFDCLFQYFLYFCKIIIRDVMKEECLICSAPLVYLEKEQSMEIMALCHSV